LDELLIAMSGATTGKIGFNRTGKTMYQNQRVGRFRETHSLSLEYLAYVLQTKVEEHLSISAGAAQPNLSTKQITEIKMPIPAVSIQKEVVRKLGEFRELSNALSLKYKQSITDIADLRQSLLQQAFSGQL
jgi:type I restriction enzyme S subunit